MCIETCRQSSQDESSWEFPDGPVVKMLCFHSMDEVKSLVAELGSHDPHSQKEFLNIFVMSIPDTGQALSHWDGQDGKSECLRHNVPLSFMLCETMDTLWNYLALSVLYSKTRKILSQEGGFLQLHFFFLKTALAIQGLLYFHINCENFCSSSVKNVIGNLIRDHIESVDCIW